VVFGVFFGVFLAFHLEMGIGRLPFGFLSFLAAAFFSCQLSGFFTSNDPVTQPF